jgi:hypothetical protein
MSIVTVESLLLTDRGVHVKLEIPYGMVLSYEVFMGVTVVSSTCFSVAKDIGLNDAELYGTIL